MKFASAPLYAVYIASVASAMPESGVARRAPAESNSDLDMDLSEKKGLGLQDVTLAMATDGHSRFDWAMKWVGRVTGPPALGYALYGIAEDCEVFHEDGKAVDGNKCIPNVVWAGVSALMCGVGYGHWVIEIGTSLQQYAVARSGEMLGELWNKWEIYGPFTRPENPIPMPPVKPRAANGDILKRAEESMSQKMGLEVRHIGLWSGLMPGEEAKRNEREKSYPVFAFRRDDADFHAAYIGEHGEGQGSRFKVGVGPGPETEHNVQRLKARQFPEEDALYNDHYFDRGGVDIFGHVQEFLDPEDYLGDEDPEDDMQWLHDEIYCTMNSDGPGSDYSGLWFAVKDHENSLSYVTGGVAAFYPGVPSIINYMTSEPWLETNEDCTVDDPYLND